MRLQNRMFTMASFCVAGLMLFAFTGCEDPQARSNASDAGAAVKALEAKINALEASNAQLLQQIKSMQDVLGKQVADRMDKVEEKVLLVSKDLLDKVAKDAEQTRLAATGIVTSARGDYDKELNGVKTTLAGDIQKIREEMKASLEDLKKYMDNQLRDLYPYAYQPRRGEGKAPPEADQK